MTRKNIYRLLAILMALTVSGFFMFCDLGLEMTPLTKFFVIFFGAIIGSQSPLPHMQLRKLCRRMTQ